jgi:PPOX class probable F420-dependent enzyme
MEDLGDLAELRLLAVLATYRRDGTVLLSPVWHEWREGGFGVVTSSRDVKVAHLRRDPRASIVVCEHSPPYRGVEVRGHARFVTAGVSDAVQRIASRYLGPEAGAAYADRADDDLLIRLEPGDLRAWDFAGEHS